MATTSYYCNIGGVTAGADGRDYTMSLSSGSVLPSGATINSIYLDVGMSAGGYSSSKDWRIADFSVDGTGVYISEYYVSMSSNREHIGTYADFSQSDAWAFTSSSIGIHIKVNTTHSSTSYMQDATLTIDYTKQDNPTAPTLSIAPQSVGKNGAATLSWHGASSGYNNKIRGYTIYRDGIQLATTKARDSTYAVVGSTSNNTTFVYQIVTNGLNGTFSNYSNAVTLRTEWSDPLPPSNVKLNNQSSLAVGKEQTVTLSWDAGIHGTNNEITGYYLYSKVGNSEEKTIKIEKNITSVEVVSPATNGTSCIYQLQTIGTYSNSTWTTPITLTTSWTDPTSPKVYIKTNVTNERKSDIYIGKNEIPTITLEWEKGKDGINNPIQKYRIFKNGTEIEQVNSDVTSLSITSDVDAIYKIDSKGANSYSVECSNEVRLKFLDEPPAPTFTYQPPEKTAKNLEYSWTPIPKKVGWSKITYGIRKKESWAPEVPEPNYIVDINDINEGDSFYLKVCTYAYAIDGGWIGSIWVQSNATVRVKAFTLPTPFIVAHYDPEGIEQSGIRAVAYSSIRIDWNTPVKVEPNSFFNYTVQYRVGNGEWNKKTTTDITYTIPIDKIPQGSQIEFRITVNDGYYEIQSEPFKMTRLLQPTVNDLKIEEVKYNEIDNSFKWNYDVGSGDTLSYKTILYYNDNFYEGDKGQLDNSVTLLQTSKNIFSLQNGGAASNLFIKQLYDEVIVKKKTKIPGRLKLQLFYTHFPLCKKESIIDFQYDFFRPIAITPSFDFLHKKAYYNEKDIINFSVGQASWKDAAESQQGAQISYSIQSTIDPIKNIVPGTVQQIAPYASQDIAITYTLTTRLKYADAEDIATSTLTTPIARWTKDDVLELGKLNNTSNSISGIVILPDRLWSSQLYNNLAGLKIYVKLQGQEQVLIKTISGIPLEKQYAFTISAPDKEFTVTGIVEATNTSGKVLTKESLNYLIRKTDVDIAIRKGRIGINVSKDFKSGEDVSAVYVSAKPSSTTSPVVEVISNESSMTGDIIDFKEGATLLGKVHKIGKGENSQLMFSGLCFEKELIIPKSLFSKDKTPIIFVIEDDRIGTNTTQIITLPNQISQKNLEDINKITVGTIEQQMNKVSLEIYYSDVPTADIPIKLIIYGI